MSGMVTARCVHTQINGIDSYTFPIKAKDLIFMHYIAVRGVDNEEGAVQRPLSSRRIQGIKEYILEGNSFFNSFILNWTSGKKVKISNGEISFPLLPKSAQVIDGQHRLAGLQEAAEQSSEVGDRTLLVTFCIGLTTHKAAQIFLNINTEQKPAPKSLIYDLFGEAAPDPKHAINRARDIAEKLNDDEDSPLKSLIKFPGAPRGSGKIELSTFVAALKPSLEADGEFTKRKLSSIEHQYAVMRNFFQALKGAYEKAGIWTNSSQNPFFKAAGFNGAIDFLTSKLLFKCAETGDFSESGMAKVMSISSDDYIKWDDMKGLDGKTARKKVTEHLEKGLSRSTQKSDEFKF